MFIGAQIADAVPESLPTIHQHLSITSPRLKAKSSAPGGQLVPDHLALFPRFRGTPAVAPNKEAPVSFAALNPGFRTGLRPARAPTGKSPLTRGVGAEDLDLLTTPAGHDEFRHPIPLLDRLDRRVVRMSAATARHGAEQCGIEHGGRLRRVGRGDARVGSGYAGTVLEEVFQGRINGREEPVPDARLPWNRRFPGTCRAHRRGGSSSRGSSRCVGSSASRAPLPGSAGSNRNR